MKHSSHFQLNQYIGVTCTCEFQARKIKIRWSVIRIFCSLTQFIFIVGFCDIYL